MKKGHQLAQMLLVIATKFDGIFDKAGSPYILHCLKVMHYSRSEDEEVQCICLGHDIIEDIFTGNIDNGVMFLKMHGFTHRIINGIVCMTKVPGETYEQYKAKVGSNPDSVIAKKADLRHNSDIKRLKGVTPKDIARTIRYHEFYQELEAIS